MSQRIRRQNNNTPSWIQRLRDKAALVAGCLTLSVIVSTSAIVAGTPTLDQAQLTANQSVAIQPGNSLGQTFTPQLAGFLSGIEVSIGQHGLGQDIHAEVWSQGLLVGMVILPVEDIGPSPNELVDDSVTGTYVDFTPFAIPTVVGSTMEVRFKLLNGPHLASVRRSTVDVYANGNATTNGNPDSGDITFKTFVESFVPQGQFDHFQPDGTTQSVATRPGLVMGQTMTVVGSGLVQALELSLSAPVLTDEDLDLQLFRHPAGGGEVALGSVTLTAEQINANAQPRFLRHAQVVGTLVNLESLNVSVSPGDVLEFRLFTAHTGSGFYTTRRVTTDVYAGGQATNNGLPGGGDLAFKLFVSEPAMFRDGFESGDTTSWE